MSDRHTGIPATIVAMEKAALSRWAKGDPSGFLDISDAKVTYFDPYVPRRIDGLPALTKYYEALRDQVTLDAWKILNPSVAVHGEVAVLAFNFVSAAGDDESRWNCTEVYRSTSDGWRIIQTHWSLTECGVD